MKKQNLSTRAGLIAALVLCGIISAPAATNLVTIASYFFTPMNITVNAGDTIVWSNTAAIGHDTTSRDGLWASGLLAHGATFTHTFPSTGIFGYICATHVDSGIAPGMTGMVSVVSASVPPFVSLTNPPNNARFVAPASFPLVASAAGNGGATVTNVQFFSGATLLSSQASSPYQFSEANLAAGNYSFTARAFDNQGLSSTSAPVIIQVLTNAVLSNLIVTPGAAQFTVNGIAAQTYIAEFSTNASAWTPFSTNVAPAPAFTITNSPVPDDIRLYRVKQTLQ
jgi:plastocyanin